MIDCGGPKGVSDVDHGEGCLGRSKEPRDNIPRFSGLFSTLTGNAGFERARCDGKSGFAVALLSNIDLSDDTGFYKDPLVSFIRTGHLSYTTYSGSLISPSILRLLHDLKSSEHWLRIANVSFSPAKIYYTTLTSRSLATLYPIWRTSLVI